MWFVNSSRTSVCEVNKPCGAYFFCILYTVYCIQYFVPCIQYFGYCIQYTFIWLRTRRRGNICMCLAPIGTTLTPTHTIFVYKKRIYQNPLKIWRIALLCFILWSSRCSILFLNCIFCQPKSPRIANTMTDTLPMHHHTLLTSLQLINRTLKFF